MKLLIDMNLTPEWVKALEAKGPSVIQVRTNNTTPESLIATLLKALNQFEDRLKEGALITIVPGKMRARILPLKQK